MSVKIYSGYRLPGDVNLARFSNQLAARLQPTWRRAAIVATTLTGLLLTGKPGDPADLAAPESDAQRLEQIVRAISGGQLDCKDVTMLGACSTLWGQAAAIVEAVQERLDRPRALRVLPLFDLTVSVWYLPDPLSARWTYAIWYAEQPEFQEIWVGSTGVQPWPYWDNSDKPDGVTEQKWEQRDKVWGRVHKPGGVVWKYPMPGLWVAAHTEKWLSPKAGLSWLALERRVRSTLSDGPAFSDRTLEQYAERLAGPALAVPGRAASNRGC
jgi:hypothetical protein